jgi:nucleotide-binding universal stress UspA family protein
MTPIQNVLVATDFSECSEAALAMGRTIAQDRGARLVVLHVDPELDVGRDVGISTADLKQRDRSALDDVRKRLEGADLKFPVRTLLRKGDAVSGILATAREERPDLIVMGTHGRHGLGRFLVGSVAEAVLRDSPYSVLIVKPAATTHSEAPGT